MKKWMILNLIANNLEYLATDNSPKNQDGKSVIVEPVNRVKLIVPVFVSA